MNDVVYTKGRIWIFEAINRECVRQDDLTAAVTVAWLKFSTEFWG